ncbi:hypothetical protein DFR29_12919 [Tahibacter aquaticus]|jgi:Arc/MetJ-type ribon-helix-helix transcriptional regulator|uniref:Uncharacterized protein n=1 Tax=Tahibacter aquaticus TaxID=520092 RepID=A0A4R6YHR0_9GAMM|nr:hypothetical protein DFR29_12919 [Tahibacter aquaticus]
MTKILTASIPLPDQLDEAIRDVIESGEYDTQVDVIQCSAFFVSKYICTL